jgi:hypothetical protein
VQRVQYLKNPNKNSSIMPKPFFLKFSMKEKPDLDDKAMHKFIKEYLEEFDIKKRLVL